MNTKVRVFLGALICLGSTWMRVPDLRHGVWAQALLGFAALVVVPLLIDLVGDELDGPVSRRLLRTAAWLQFPSSLLLVFAYAGGPGVWAALSALPWTLVLLLLSGTGVLRVVQRGSRPLPLLCRDTGLIYAAVGAAWLMADRLGLHPLDFDESIVLLTAIHFHYAGLIVPVLTGFALGLLPGSRLVTLIGVGVIAGVPAVAVGITASQFHLDPRIELVAALLMALSGLGLAALHLLLGLQQRRPVAVRCLWVVAGCSLTAGMLLAVLYGVRNFFHPWPWLDIPWMRALHGSINALGFGFCGVLGWWLLRGRPPASTRRG